MVTKLPDGEIADSLTSILDEVAHRFRDIQRSSERGIALLQMARAIADREGKDAAALQEMQRLFFDKAWPASSAESSASEQEEGTTPNGGFRLDATSGFAEIGDERIPLTRSEFKVLELLWEERPSPVSRDALLDRLYPEESRAESGALDVFIHQLRKKLSALDTAETQILSIRGRGWKLVI